MINLKELYETIMNEVAVIVKRKINDLSATNKEPMTYNQRMSLNEMAQLNVGEDGLSKKDSFDSNVYYVYVIGEGGYKKFPHFHIKHKAEGWDIRMNIDGSFHSIKKKAGKRQKNDDFIDIERISKKWVLKASTLNDKLTNGELANILWKSQNS